MITAGYALTLLDIAIDKAGSRDNFCKTYGISNQYLSDVCCKKTSIGPSILKVLGLKKIVMYEEIDGHDLVKSSSLKV